MAEPGTVSGVWARRAWHVAAALAWAATAVVSVLQYRAAVSKVWFGVDIRPMRAAGAAVLDGGNVFDAHNFVYPPTAAVVSVPLARLDVHVLDRATLVVMIVVVAAVSALSVQLFAPARPWRPAVAALFAGVVLAGNTSYHALPLDNVSVLLAPFVLAVVQLFGRGRWWAGCVVLQLSILLKPLLVVLLLVPLLARRWLALVVTSAVAAGVLLASLPLGGGVDRATRVVHKLLEGSIMVGFRAVGNLSLTGFASVHGVPGPMLTAARLAVGALAVVSCLAAARSFPWDTAGVAWLTAVLLGAEYLAGNLSEVHYLFTLIPGAVALLARAPSWIARALAAAGLVALCVPLWWVDNRGEQIASLVGEVALFLAGVIAVLVASVAAGAATRTAAGEGATRSLLSA